MPYKLSPSGLSLFRECPRCFWLDFVKGIERPGMIFPSLPGGMDRLLKSYFDSFRRKRQLPPELSKLKGVKLFYDIALLKAWRAPATGLHWTDRKGNILRGAVDEILQKGDKLIVLDFKTRGYPLKEDSADYYYNQLDIYTYLLHKNGFKTEDYAYLLFYHPTKVYKSGKVMFQSDLVKLKVSPRNATKLFKEALKVLKGRMPKPAEDCEYCEWAEEYNSEYK